MPPPYQQSGAAVAFWVLLALWAAGEYLARFRGWLHGRGAPAERWSLLVVVAGIGCGVAGALVLAGRTTTRIETGAWALFVAGLAVMTIGILIRQWAIITLGRFFTVDVRVQPDQTIVDNGPYRWVRHPSYTGLIVFFTGLGLALTDWASLILVVVLPTAGLIIRIRSEERILLTGLGEPYRRYAASRRRLLPGVW